AVVGDDKGGGTGVDGAEDAPAAVQRRGPVERGGHVAHRAVRAANRSRTPGTARKRLSAKSAWPGTDPLRISRVTSAASPSAPTAAAENDVAMLKKMTVPPSAVARIAPCSQPGTSTQTTVTSAGPPRAAVTATASDAGSRASASATWSAIPARVSRSCSTWFGTTPTVRAPARPAAASESDPDLPAPPSTATEGAARKLAERPSAVS